MKKAEKKDEPEAPVVVVVPKDTSKVEPPFGTVEWLYFWGQFEGLLPTPINVSITGSMAYTCPELKWYNFEVYPHKIKLTNTGYTLLVGAKWMTERPYLEGGCLKDKHVLSQIHFHWGADMTEGSDHTLDKLRYPGEMHVTYFRSEYLTQEEALKHVDGVVVVCYMIKYGVNPDIRLSRLIEGFPRIQLPQTKTKIGPYPMYELMPLFSEDYFLYWGRLSTMRGDNYAVRWLVPRVPLFASLDQMKEFRKLCNPWDEPNLRNFRPLQERGTFVKTEPDWEYSDTPDVIMERHIWLINPHWSLHNSTLPIPRLPEPSISELSPEYKAKLWMLPKQNQYMIEEMTQAQTQTVDMNL